MRGARIETFIAPFSGSAEDIAPHAGSVNWKIKWSFTSTYWFSRSPYGERELKIQGLMMLKEQIMSLPTQGARIEIIAVSSGNTAQIAPHAESENWNIDWYILIDSLKNRSPCRERELKSSNQRGLYYLPDIAPRQGARIEINTAAYYLKKRDIAPQVRSENWNQLEHLQQEFHDIAPQAGSENWNWCESNLRCDWEYRFPRRKRELKFEYGLCYIS